MLMACTGRAPVSCVYLSTSAEQACHIHLHHVSTWACDLCLCVQHAVTFAAGLACEGMIPFAAIYSSFLQRGYDQIVHDVCLQSLPGAAPLGRSWLLAPARSRQPPTCPVA